MTHFRSNNDSLKYQRLTPLGCKDKAILKSEFVAKTQFLCKHSIGSDNLKLISVLNY